jgi:hypothetical protein
MKGLHWRIVDVGPLVAALPAAVLDTFPDLHPPPSNATVCRHRRNTAPTALSQALSAPHDTPIVITLRATDHDPNTAFIFAMYQNPAHGTVSSLNPHAGFTGDDHFSFTFGVDRLS